jgi:hypothetical protein
MTQWDKSSLDADITVTTSAIRKAEAKLAALRRRLTDLKMLRSALTDTAAVRVRQGLQTIASCLAL